MTQKTKNPTVAGSVFMPGTGVLGPSLAKHGGVSGRVDHANVVEH